MAGEAVADQGLPGRRRGQGAAPADRLEPALAGGDVADLVLVDTPQHGGALSVAGALEAFDNARRDVEPARFEHQWHHR